MKTSEKTETLFAKLFEALHDMPAVEKNNTAGGNFKYKYADLDSVVNKAKPILQKCELSFIQSIGNVDGKQTLTTRLFHKSGEWIEDTTILPHAKLNGGNEAQEMGSAITYIRRYSLCAMLGIVSDDDTDGVIKQPQQQRPIKNLEPKIQELKSYYSIITPEAQTACSLAIADHDEAKIDQYIKQAKEKKEKMIQEGIF